MDEIITLAQFTPAEAERITGVNTALQRDWRRRGYLPSNEGQARFDVFQLARMTVLKLLADRGIGPALSHEEAEWCALAAVHSAFRDRDAWDGEHKQALTWLDEYASPPPVDPMIVAFVERANEQGADVPVPTEGSHWGEQSLYLTRRLWRHTKQARVLPAPLFIWWADGSHTFDTSFEKARGATFSTDPKVAGPIIILDLDAVGGTLVDRAGRAFAHVEFVPVGEGDAARNEREGGLEYGAPVPLDRTQFGNNPE